MTTTLLDPTTTATLRIEAWLDPLVDGLGHDARSRYVETYWLPVLGPSTTWLLRRVASRLDAEPEGFEMDLDETARTLGLGAGGEQLGRRSPFLRALARCVDFEMARFDGPRTLAVRRFLPSVAQRQLLRLPAQLREQHDRHVESDRLAAVEQLRSRARLLAASLVELGEDTGSTELHLMRWGLHPALAGQCAAWASSAQRATSSGGPPPGR